MRKNRQRVEKTKLCVSIPTELLNECDLYVENYSAFFTACLRNKLSSIQRKQLEKENADIIQISRTYGSNETAVSSTLPHKVRSISEKELREREEQEAREYEELKARYLEELEKRRNERARKES